MSHANDYFSQMKSPTVTTVVRVCMFFQWTLLYLIQNVFAPWIYYTMLLPTYNSGIKSILKDIILTASAPHFVERQPVEQTFRRISVSTERLKINDVRCSEKYGKACYISHCKCAQLAKQKGFSLLIGSNDVERYDDSNFPHFVDPNVNSDGPTNRLSIRQLTIGRINVSSSMNFDQNPKINILILPKISSK